MSLIFTGTGGLFTRLGKLQKAINAQNEWRGSTATSLLGGVSLGGFINTAIAQLDAEANQTIRQTYADLGANLAQAYKDTGKYQATIRAAAQSLLAQQVYADNPLIPSLGLADTLGEVIRQMTGAYHVTPNTVAAVVTPGGSNVGNGICLAEVANGAGISRQYQYAETVLIDCTDNATIGSETFNAIGSITQPDPLAADWPRGSGVTATLNAFNASNVGFLTNGSFDTFSTTDNADGWTYTTGAASAQIFETNSVVYAGPKAIFFLGDAGTSATHTEIRRALTNPTALTAFAMNIWLKANVVPAAGVLRIELWDPGAAAVINDPQGNPNRLDITLSGITTSYVNHHTIFRLPASLPATVQIRVWLQTALSTGSNLYMDHLSLNRMTPMYTGGPLFAIASGSVNFSLNDVFSVAVANDWAGAWQQSFQRLFGIQALDLQLPTSGGTLVNNSLIA